MISWDDAQTISQKLAQDSSTSAASFLNMMMNVGYKEVLMALGRQVTEQQSTTTLVVNQRNYQVPPDCNWPKTLVLVNGTTRTVVTEEPSDKMWELRRYGVQTGLPTKFHFRPRFGVGGGILELDPIPGTAYTLEMTYEATERDLSKTKYVTGTIALTQGSAVVTGSGTTFAADMAGRYLRPLADAAQRLPYRIKTYTNATSITMEQVYQNTSQSAMAFEIIELFSLPEDIHMLPIYYALWQWWDSKGNVTRAKAQEEKYAVGLIEAKKRHSIVTRDNIIDDDGTPGMLGADYPWFFPAGVTS